MDSGNKSSHITFARALKDPRNVWHAKVEETQQSERRAKQALGGHLAK